MQNPIVKTKSRVLYKQDLIEYVSEMTLCDARLAEEILDAYVASISDFLYENGHYQQKRTVSLNKWGSYSFEPKIQIKIINKKSNAYFLAGVVFKSSPVLCKKAHDAQWQNYIWKYDDAISQSLDDNENCRQTQLSYYNNSIALPDYAKLKWNETDLVNMVAFKTQIYKKVIRYVLRAFHQAILDFFITAERKHLVVEGLGTFSMQNDRIIMRPCVREGQKCRRAITTRRQPATIKKRRKHRRKVRKAKGQK